MKKKRKLKNQEQFKTLDNFLESDIKPIKNTKKVKDSKNTKEKVQKLKAENENLKEKLKSLKQKKGSEEKLKPQSIKTTKQEKPLENTQPPKLVIASNKQYTQQFQHFQDNKKGSGFEENPNN